MGICSQMEFLLPGFESSVGIRASDQILMSVVVSCNENIDPLGLLGPEADLLAVALPAAVTHVLAEADPVSRSQVASMLSSDGFHPSGISLVYGFLTSETDLDGRWSCWESNRS